MEFGLDVGETHDGFQLRAQQAQVGLPSQGPAVVLQILQQEPAHSGHGDGVFECGIHVRAALGGLDIHPGERVQEVVEFAAARA